MLHYAFTAESDGERVLKIDQQFAKLWAGSVAYRFLIKHGVFIYSCFRCHIIAMAVEVSA